MLEVPQGWGLNGIEECKSPPCPTSAPYRGSGAFLKYVTLLNSILHSIEWHIYFKTGLKSILILINVIV